MKRIDAHQQIWQSYRPTGGWIGQDVKSLQWDCLQKDLWPFLYENGFEGCVAVQTNQSEKETDLLIAMAKQHKFIKGVVGWIDLMSEDIIERLEWYRSFQILKGFRHLLHKEPRRGLMIQPKFKRGIKALHRYGFTYDILIFPDQLRFASHLATSFPEQKFVIDLVTGPNLDSSEAADWKADIKELALRENVYCKIPGMVSNSGSREPMEDFRVYMDEIVEAFGMDRLMYGSDWPLSNAAASQVATRYEEVSRMVQDYFSVYSKEEQELFYIWNAVNFYNL